MEGNDLKLCVDVSVPTDRQLTERRPDLVVFAKEKRKIIIFDVACAWKPLLNEREGEKREKYQELARDMATQWKGWKSSVVPLVVGDLASLFDGQKLKCYLLATPLRQLKHSYMQNHHMEICLAANTS